MGGMKADELAAGFNLYTFTGFSEVFHPDMIKQLVVEKRIGEVKYTFGERTVSYLVPKGSKAVLTNVGV